MGSRRDGDANPQSPSVPRARIEVVAAVMQRPDGRFLLAQRPAGKAYAGYWEFPGGKVESGESARDAVRRELVEELGIEAEDIYPWITREYDYEHAAVRLRFHRVTRWGGTPHGREAQRFEWQSSGALTVAPMLPANGPVLRALALPTVYGITGAGDFPTAFMGRLRSALDGGLRLVQIREPAMPEAEFGRFVADVMKLATAAGAQVLVNGDVGLARRAGAHGVHLSAARLMRATARPPFDLVGASCHNAVELQRAVSLAVDFVVLGPVQPTPSHPGARAMGWERFAALTDGCPIPVFALGGLQSADIVQAWRCGAHGIAMMRGAWV